MIFVFNKRLLIAVFSMLLFVLLIADVMVRTSSPYAILGGTWEGVGGGRDYRAINGVASVVSIPGGTRTRRPHGFGSLSPDSQTAIVGGFRGHDGVIHRVWENTTETFHFKPYVQGSAFWSPDSKYFALSVATRGCDKCQWSYPRDVGIFDVATGALRLVTRGEFYVGDSLVWSPDQLWLAYVDARFDSVNRSWIEAVKLIPVDSDGSQSPRTLLTHVGTSDSDALNPWLVWMPDGGHIAIIGNRGMETEIWYLDVQTRHIIYHYQTSQIQDLCWSPQTDHFLAVSDTTFKMVAMTRAGAQALDLDFIDPSIWRLRPGSTVPCAWSPDGAQLALVYSQRDSLSPGVKVIDFVGRKVSDIQVTGRYAFLKPYWSPDSRMLALKTYNVSRNPNDIFIYDMTTPKEPIFFEKDLEFDGWFSLPAQ